MRDFPMSEVVAPFFWVQSLSCSRRHASCLQLWGNGDLLMCDELGGLRISWPDSVSAEQ